MTKEDISELQTSLNEEYGKRLRLGGYSADAECLRLLTGGLLSIVRHLAEVSKEMERIKRRIPAKKTK